MELILVRHAEPAALVVATGGADPDLTVRGDAQARALAESGALAAVDLLVQSPAGRAIQTARPLAESLGLEPVTVAGLAEWDWGCAEYAPVESFLPGDPRLEALRRGEPYGEVDVVAFRARVLRTFATLAEQNRGRRVVAVCHGGVINTYIGDVLGVERLFWFAPEYSSFSRVAVGGGRRTVLSVNETPHLLPVRLGAAS